MENSLDAGATSIGTVSWTDQQLERYRSDLILLQKYDFVIMAWIPLKCRIMAKAYRQRATNLWVRVKP